MSLRVTRERLGDVVSRQAIVPTWLETLVREHGEAAAVQVASRDTFAGTFLLSCEIEADHAIPQAGIAPAISCGCCQQGCCCRNHMDIPRGVRPRICAAHGGPRFLSA